MRCGCQRGGNAMPAVSLTTAIATYGHTKALKDGTIQSERIVLEHRDVSPITSAFRQMVRTLAFDVSEMAFSTYLCARVYHKPITALPVFLLRRFEHGAMVYNVKSGIQSPLDLHGRRVGVRSYTLTPGVWMRGILQSAYGVHPQQVQWVLFGDEHVAEYVAPSYVTPAPAGRDMVSMLLAGEIDAAIGVSGVDEREIRPLIPGSGLRGRYSQEKPLRPWLLGPHWSCSLDLQANPPRDCVPCVRAVTRSHP